MEYNKSKKILDKLAGIFGIIAASIYLIVAVALVVDGIIYLIGGHNYQVYSYGYGYRTIDISYEGTPLVFSGLFVLALAILMLIFSIKLVKSPYLPNGELRKKQAARIWVLVLSVLTGDLVVLGLSIAALCVKEFKDVNNKKQISNATTKRPAYNQEESRDFYERIQEVKKLKSLGIIEDAVYKKAITKIVSDIIKD